MSDEPKNSRSRAWRWIAWAAFSPLALALAYVLIAPPLLRYAVDNGYERAAAPYSKPLDWACNSQALAKIINRYSEHWDMQFGPD